MGNIRGPCVPGRSGHICSKATSFFVRTCSKATAILEPCQPWSPDQEMDPLSGTLKDLSFLQKVLGSRGGDLELHIRDGILLL